MKLALGFLIMFLFAFRIGNAQSVNTVELKNLAEKLIPQFKDKSIEKLAVLDFTEEMKLSSFSISVSNELKLLLIQNDVSLEIVERKYIDNVIEEQRLSLSPLFDDTSAEKIGKLISADAVVTGDIVQHSKGLLLNVQIIKVETGALAGGASIILEDEQSQKRYSGNRQIRDYDSLSEESTHTDTSTITISPLTFSGLEMKGQSLGDSSMTSILLMNGREIQGQLLGDSGTVLLVQLTKPNGRVIKREIPKSDIFSVKMGDGNEQVYYAKDEMLGDIYSVDEMRFYLAGENDARQNFGAWPTFAVGFALCTGISLFGGDGYITAVGPPILYTLLQLAPKIKIREKTMSHPDYKYNDIYADGYEPPARTRKLSRAMEGAFLGSATGVACWFLFLK